MVMTPGFFDVVKLDGAGCTWMYSQDVRLGYGKKDQVKTAHFS
jgi:hypothetical protein